MMGFWVLKNVDLCSVFFDFDQHIYVREQNKNARSPGTVERYLVSLNFTVVHVIFNSKGSTFYELHFGKLQYCFLS